MNKTENDEGRQPLVVVTDYVEPDLDWEATQLRRMGVRLEHHLLRHGSAEELARVASTADVLVVNMAQIDRSVLSNLNRCRLIIRHGVGYDNVDVAAAAELGITVTRVPDYCAAEVAEQALMLIFACQRRLGAQLAAMRSSIAAPVWDFGGVEPVHRLRGGTLGVVGCGQIGSLVLQMAEGLGVRRVAVDPRLDDPPVDGVEMVSMPTLLAEADVISVNAPLNAATRSMFGKDEFAAMKPTAILVNTARGGLVDLSALDRALADGQIAGAGIDVYDVEPPDRSVPLLGNPKAICTPHLGWMSEEAAWRIREIIVDEVRRYVTGQPPRNPVSAP